MDAVIQWIRELEQRLARTEMTVAQLVEESLEADEEVVEGPGGEPVRKGEFQ